MGVFKKLPFIFKLNIRMKLTATTTSTSLQDLIKAYDTANSTNVLQSIFDNERSHLWFGIEIMKDSADIYVETVLDEATADSRPVNDTAPIFAFNIDNLDKVYIYWNWDFFLSIV